MERVPHELFRVGFDDSVQVLGEVDHQRAADGLPRLRRAAPARKESYALLAGDLQRRAHVVLRARDHHADRLDLVHRGVGGVAAAREAVEQHLALDVAAQVLGEAMGDGR